MPMSQSFHNRLAPVLREAVNHFGTPFHIYDESGIRETGRQLIDAFSEIPEFREFFAVKALPNPHILKIMKQMGFGFDCSSIPELILSRQIGSSGEDIMFTSNNTSPEEFICAFAKGGSIINLDSYELIAKLPRMPDCICFRYNPGARRSGNTIIGIPEESKYGLDHEKIIHAYQTARNLGAQQFGIHTMLISNECNFTYMVETTQMLLELMTLITDKTDIVFDFINIGGGFGIPYRYTDTPLDLPRMAKAISRQLHRFASKAGYLPRLCIESGRYMTGPHGVLVTQVLNVKDSYRKYIGVDACMSALMRPGIYGAHHELTVFEKAHSACQIVADVVGSLCENNDKFAIQRELPLAEPGDIIIIHDTGAHGHSMGFNYNGRLRPKELLLRQDGSLELIRRAEVLDDYFATLSFGPDIFANTKNDQCAIPNTI